MYICNDIIVRKLKEELSIKGCKYGIDKDFTTSSYDCYINLQLHNGEIVKIQVPVNSVKTKYQLYHNNKCVIESHYYDKIIDSLLLINFHTSSSYLNSVI
jgi:hypothetical protein